MILLIFNDKKKTIKSNKASSFRIIDNQEILFSICMKVVKERIAVIIGKSGETKRKIEEALGVRIDLNSKTGLLFGSL